LADHGATRGEVNPTGKKVVALGPQRWGML
jgi:hypothetical protein